MPYQLSPDPNIGRNDTSFTMPKIDWQQEISLLSQYMKHSSRFADKDPAKRSEGEKEYMEFIKYSPPKEVVDQKVTANLMKAHQFIVDQATELYRHYNYEPPPEKVAQLEMNKSAFESYQNQLIQASTNYNESLKAVMQDGDKGYYDLQEFNKRRDMFIEQGVPVFDYLVINPVDASTHLRGLIKTSPEDSYALEPTEEGGWITKGTAKIPKDYYVAGETPDKSIPNYTKLQEVIKDEFSKNGRFQLGVAQDFNETVPLEEQKSKWGYDPLKWAMTSGPNGTPAKKYADLLAPEISQTKVKSEARKGYEKGKTFLKYDNSGFYRIPAGKQKSAVPMSSWYESTADGTLAPVVKDSEILHKNQQFIAVGPYNNDNGSSDPMAVFAFTKSGRQLTQQELDDINSMAKSGDALNYFMKKEAGAYDKGSSDIKLIYKPFDEDLKSTMEALGFEFGDYDQWSKQYSSQDTGDEDIDPNP